MKMYEHLRFGRARFRAGTAAGPGPEVWKSTSSFFMLRKKRQDATPSSGRTGEAYAARAE